MLHGPLPAGAESLERRIAREEPGVVVDVLRIHASASFAPCDMGGPEMAPQTPRALVAPRRSRGAPRSRACTRGPRNGPPNPPALGGAPVSPGRPSILRQV